MTLTNFLRDSISTDDVDYYDPLEALERYAILGGALEMDARSDVTWGVMHMFKEGPEVTRLDTLDFLFAFIFLARGVACVPLFHPSKGNLKTH